MPPGINAWMELGAGGMRAQPVKIFYEFDWIFMIFGQNLAIYTVFYKESESEVNTYQILEPGGKNQEKLT